MSGTVPNLCVVNGAIVRLNIRKQKKETLDARKRRISDALGLAGGHFAFKHSGVWHVYEVWIERGANGRLVDRYARFLRTLPTEDAAAMWLVHKAMRP